jgi:hypothetical protein
LPSSSCQSSLLISHQPTSAQHFLFYLFFRLFVIARIAYH